MLNSITDHIPFTVVNTFGITVLIISKVYRNHMYSRKMDRLLREIKELENKIAGGKQNEK